MTTPAEALAEAIWRRLVASERDGAEPGMILEALAVVTAMALVLHERAAADAPPLAPAYLERLRARVVSVRALLPQRAARPDEPGAEAPSDWH